MTNAEVNRPILYVSISQQMENFFQLKIVGFSRETLCLMSPDTTSNPNYLLYAFLNNMISNHLQCIPWVNKNAILSLIETFIYNCINGVFTQLCIIENKKTTAQILDKNNRLIDLIDIQLKHYSYNTKHIDVLHKHYRYTFEHHAITINLLHAIFNCILWCHSLLKNNHRNVLEKGIICVYINSLFNLFIDSIIRTEPQQITCDEQENLNDELITDFIENQNIIYNCSQETQFIGEIKQRYQTINEINTEFNRSLYVSPEFYNADREFHTRVSTLRLLVNLETTDVISLEHIGYYLSYITQYSNQLHDVDNKLKYLNTRLLDNNALETNDLLFQPDYTYPLFTIKHMFFSHNNTKPYLIEMPHELHIPSRKWVYFKGNSGTGKTTLLNLLLKIIDNKYVFLFQYKKYNMHSIRKHVILLKSNGDIFKHRTVEYNITFGLFNTQVSVIMYYFELFDLGDYECMKDKLADTLSTGEKQRCRIIHTILQIITSETKRILILDEITSNIDESVEVKIMNELRRLQIEYNLSVIHISHSGYHKQYSDYLMEISDRIVSITKQQVQSDAKRPILHH